MNGFSSIELPLVRLQNLRCPEHLVQTRAHAGANAILLFTNEERARHFVDGKKLSDRLTWIRMEESAATCWLIDVKDRIAAELVVIDAEPSEVLHERCEPLNQVLSNLRSAAGRPHGVTPSATRSMAKPSSRSSCAIPS